jgi:hypothetical protein
VGFAFTERLGFMLLPQLKDIGAIQLYAPRPARSAGPRWKRSSRSRPLLVEGTYSRLIRGVRNSPPESRAAMP